MTARPQTHPHGTPDAEVEIDADLARALLAAQHPDLAHLPITAARSGWDNAIFRLGEAYALRFPRRAVAVDLLRHEQRWLPLLAPRLPLPIPAPVRTGVADGRCPWPWSVTPWLDGETADVAPPDETQAEVLAGFFEALHLPAPRDAPRNPYRGVPLAERAAVFEARAAAVAELVPPEVPPIWKDALAAPNDALPTWIHGDPHPRNVLVRDGRITAVIDWGDLAQGDRASDLAAVWMLLPSYEGRRRAKAALGAVSEATWRRARGWAALLALTFLNIADDPGGIAIGRTTLERLIEGP